MQTRPIELTWLDARDAVSLSDLSMVCAMSEDELTELVDYGALIPLTPHRLERLFSVDCVAPLRAAGKLRLDFDLDLFTVAMLMGYLSRIDMLERQLRSLQAHLPGHIENPLAQLAWQRDQQPAWRSTSP